MNRKLTLPALLATASALTLTAAAASAENAPRLRFGMMRSHALRHYPHTPTALQTWNGSFVYNSKTYSYTMVGTNPANTNTTTTFTIYLIPVKMVYSKKIYGKALEETFDPLKDQWNGETVMDAILNSPLFTSMDWQWGSTDVGTTQYGDAFQRGSFWGVVGSTNPAYHVVFATPTVLSEQTIKVTKAEGGNVINNPFGPGKVGEMSLRQFDLFIQSTMSKFSQINPTNFPFFIVENVFLTSGGCCIGGYHDADSNGQTYGMGSFITYANSRSEDIDVISHEFGEWYDDPLVNNSGFCGGLLEVGDPLEGLANYGTFQVNVNGVTYHPQALAFLEYFGAPANSSANNWLDNQNLLSSVCQNGQ